MRAISTWVVGGLCAAASLTASSAEACGGVVSQRETSLVVQAQQRVLISVLDSGASQVVIELAIPSANEPFGALTPVGIQPTVDSVPVDVGEMESLERATRPSVTVNDSSNEGCTCSPGLGSDTGGVSKGNVNVVQIVDVGPVTAAVLSADSLTPLEQWLTANGFVVPSTEQAVVDAYVGPNKFFIAFKRSSQAPPGPSSVGVSFSAPGDLRGYALRMSRIGAASRLAIQVFVAAADRLAPNGSAPSAPFLTLTLDDLDASALASDYENAVFNAVGLRGSKAFVVEGVFKPSDDWRANLGPRLSALTATGQVLTRLTTVVRPELLDRDADFLAEPPANVPRSVVASASGLSVAVAPTRQRFSTFGLILASAFAAPLRRVARRRSSPTSRKTNSADRRRIAE